MVLYRYLEIQLQKNSQILYFRDESVWDEFKYWAIHKNPDNEYIEFSDCRYKINDNYKLEKIHKSVSVEINIEISLFKDGEFDFESDEFIWLTSFNKIPTSSINRWFKTEGRSVNVCTKSEWSILCEALDTAGEFWQDGDSYFSNMWSTVQYESIITNYGSYRSKSNNQTIQLNSLYDDEVSERIKSYKGNNCSVLIHTDAEFKIIKSEQERLGVLISDSNINFVKRVQKQKVGGFIYFSLKLGAFEISDFPPANILSMEELFNENVYSYRSNVDISKLLEGL